MKLTENQTFAQLEDVLFFARSNLGSILIASFLALSFSQPTLYLKN